MTDWDQITATEPDLAAAVRRCFAVRKHATLATLRQDGSPRISGTEVEWTPGGPWLGMMPGSRKAMDLRRDPRLALHGPTEDTPEDDPASWIGDAKIAGLSVEVSTGNAPPEGHRFRIDVTEVVLTRVAPSGDSLVITSWHPGRGLEIVTRR